MVKAMIGIAKKPDKGIPDIVVLLNTSNVGLNNKNVSIATKGFIKKRMKTIIAVKRAIFINAGKGETISMLARDDNVIIRPISLYFIENSLSFLFT